ncbi:MAG: hypothetical protein KAI71_05160 [Candidatus Pacebacteria bacterium]|nr:hypothetical protein [Candidatus Paceibacterota bacterium]
MCDEFDLEETKRLIAEAASLRCGKEIKLKDIKLNYNQGTRTVGWREGEKVERYKEFSGVTIVS